MVGAANLIALGQGGALCLEGLGGGGVVLLRELRGLLGAGQLQSSRRNPRSSECVQLTSLPRCSSASRASASPWHRNIRTQARWAHTVAVRTWVQVVTAMTCRRKDAGRDAVSIWGSRTSRLKPPRTEFREACCFYKRLLAASNSPSYSPFKIYSEGVSSRS